MKKNLKLILLSIFIIPSSIFLLDAIYIVVRNIYGYNILTEAMFSLLMTIVAYVTFPMLYILFYGKTEKDHAAKIATINSIIICIFFIVLRASLNLTNTYSFIPAIFYGTINYSYLKLPKNNNNSGDDKNETK